MSKTVTVLGVHDGHNAGAALVRDGRVLAALSEERITNVKNQSGVPLKSIRRVFEIARVAPSEVDAIAMVGLLRTHAPLSERPFHVKLYERLTPLVHGHAFSHLLVKVLHRFRKMEEIHNLLVELKIQDREVFFVEHHLTHAACAHYQRPWDNDTLVLTLDGSGDALSATVSIGRKLRIDRIASSTQYDSLSNMVYSEITGYLGLKRWEHEYKVMGLAPYGREEFCIHHLEKILRINPRKPLEFQNISGKYLSQLQPVLRRYFAEQRFDNIAAACQIYFERLLATWVKNCVQHSGLNMLACGGGAFLNVKANKLLREMPEVADIFVYPACDDSGTPVGAALETYFRYCEREGITPARHALADLYYGSEFDNDYVKQCLQSSGWLRKAGYRDSIEEDIAGLISDGKVIARFTGRDEWGPRALGNRTIIADPRDLNAVRKLNVAIKHRDFWMPFAPSVLEERAPDYFVRARPARYMVEAFDTTPAGEQIIAALHPFDRTGRPQTVNDWNPSYRKVLLAFQQRTGVGGVLNTSFNLHGYPIVGSPETALWTLENSELDGLAIGNWLVMR